MIRRPPRSTLSSSSAASDVYKRQPVFLLLISRLLGYPFGGISDPAAHIRVRLCNCHYNCHFGYYEDSVTIRVSPLRQSHVLRRKNVIARLRFPLMTLLELTVQWLIALDFFEQKGISNMR